MSGDETRRFIVSGEWYVDTFSDADMMRWVLDRMGAKGIEVIRETIDGDLEDGW